MEDHKNLINIKKESLKTLLRLYKNANAGHIGASLSCLDILIHLFFVEMEKKDKFILSKGHAAAALYTMLAKSGVIEESLLSEFYKEGTNFAAHPPCNGNVSGITFGTGSLGHGLSLSCGMAISNRYTDLKFNVYCVLSEGDCNEGSTWEAALFAGQHHLDNLVVIIDNNKLQGFGTESEIINLEPLKLKWESFNFEVITAENGNSFVNLDEAFYSLKKTKSSRPKCIIAKTTKGSGISYMESKMEWHYLPMSEEQYQKALLEIEGLDA